MGEAPLPAFVNPIPPSLSLSKHAHFLILASSTPNLSQFLKKTPFHMRYAVSPDVGGIGNKWVEATTKSHAEDAVSDEPGGNDGSRTC